MFDASTETKSGIILNDVLLKGKIIQDDLIYILVRFRIHIFVVSADIKKMYHQVGVAKKHHDY